MLLALFAAIAKVLASDRQMAIAWVLAKGEDIVSLIGSRKVSQIQEARGALEVRLPAEEVARLEAAVPAEKSAGSRYDKHQMAMLDSEK